MTKSTLSGIVMLVIACQASDQSKTCCLVSSLKVQEKLVVLFGVQRDSERYTQKRWDTGKMEGRCNGQARVEEVNQRCVQKDRQ